MTADREAATAPTVWQRLELRTRPVGDGAEVGEPTGPWLWPALGTRLDDARPCPRLRAELVFKPLPPDAGPGMLLADPAGGHTFHLGAREATLLPLLDGTRDVQAITREAAPLSPLAIDQFVQELRLAGLLDEGAGLWQRLAAPRRSGPLVLWSLNGEETLAALHRRLRFWPGPLAWSTIAVLLLAAAALTIARWPAIYTGLAVLGADPWPRLLLVAVAAYGLMIPVALTHELAHALACVHFGGHVARLGLMIRHFLPAAFADVSDVYFLPRRARITVYLAGPASTLAWMAIAAIVCAWAPSGSFGQGLAAAVALLAALAALAGLNPVAGYDASDALAEWLAIPNLHRRALGDLALAAHLTRRLPTPTSDRRVLRVYGLAWLVYNAVALAVAIILFVFALR